MIEIMTDLCKVENNDENYDNVIITYSLPASFQYFIQEYMFMV